MEINFFSEDTDKPSIKEDITKRWLSSIANEHNYLIVDLNYIFCTDDYLYEINLEYLKHDDFTDIITFDNSDIPNSIEADIFISIDRVRENSQKFKVEFHYELHRVIVHGLLHLLGFGDKTEEEKALMRKNEDACLSLLPKIK